MLSLSVVVPVYNEEGALPAFLDSCRAWEGDCELLFVDGGSDDATRELLAGRRVLDSSKGRGQQCRRGAAAATGDALLFLHADSRLPRESFDAVTDALAEGASWGCLTLRFEGARGLGYGFGALVSNLRVRLTGIAFGDQAMFMRKDLLEEVGGVPPLALMEDYELARRLRARAWPRQLGRPVMTSPRRFEGNALAVALGMRRLRSRYRRGEPIESLLLDYPDVRRDRHGRL